jgi:hypothetical protein
LLRVVWYKFTDVSEVLAASIFRAISIALLPDYTVQQPRIQPSSMIMFSFSSELQDTAVLTINPMLIFCLTSYENLLAYGDERDLSSMRAS